MTCTICPSNVIDEVGVEYISAASTCSDIDSTAPRRATIRLDTVNNASRDVDVIAGDVNTEVQIRYRSVGAGDDKPIKNDVRPIHLNYCIVSRDGIF